MFNIIEKNKNIKVCSKNAASIMMKYVTGPMICVGMNYVKAKLKIYEYRSEVCLEMFKESKEDIKECWGLK